jgi:hypothetical protein
MHEQAASVERCDRGEARDQHSPGSRSVLRERALPAELLEHDDAVVEDHGPGFSGESPAGPLAFGGGLDEPKRMTLEARAEPERASPEYVARLSEARPGRASRGDSRPEEPVGE